MLKRIRIMLSLILSINISFSTISCRSNAEKPTLLHKNGGGQTESSKPNKEKENIYFLGDSLSDTGGFLKVLHNVVDQFKSTPLMFFLKDKLEQLSSIKLPKYYYKNRFSNGQLASEKITEKLNDSEIESGWDLNLKLIPGFIEFNDHTIGNNYAFSAAYAYYNEQNSQNLIDKFYNLLNNNNNIKALTDVLIELILDQFSLVKQANALIKHHADSIKENDVFLIQIGGNDIIKLADEIKNLPSNEVPSYVNKYLNNSITNIERTITNLINNKAKKIVVTNCVDLSRTPKFQKYDNHIKKYTLDLVTQYNKILDQKITDLQVKNASIIKKYDLFEFTNKAIDRMKANGKNVTQAATLGFNFLELFDSTMEDKNYPNYDDPKLDNYFFLDDIHPTKEIHRLLSEEIYNLVSNWS